MAKEPQKAKEGAPAELSAEQAEDTEGQEPETEDQQPGAADPEEPTDEEPGPEPNDRGTEPEIDHGTAMNVPDVLTLEGEAKTKDEYQKMRGRKFEHPPKPPPSQSKHTIKELMDAQAEKDNPLSGEVDAAVDAINEMLDGMDARGRRLVIHRLVGRKLRIA